MINGLRNIVEIEMVVFSAEVPLPVSVRYAWVNSPVANLINREGLPASPFRLTNGKK